jgi:RNA-directed DNA polymerase
MCSKSLDRFKARVRELWDARRRGTSEELKEEWQSYLRGWWNYYRLAEWRRPIFSLEGWIRRHIRKCFWQRWQSRRGRLKALRRLGLSGPHLQVARSSKGAWRIGASPSLQTALRNATLLRYGFLVPSDFARAEGA